MLIYKIPNASINNFWYVCDSQVTIDAIPVAKKTQQPIIDPALCSIGSQIEADVLLLQYQKIFQQNQRASAAAQAISSKSGGSKLITVTPNE